MIDAVVADLLWQARDAKYVRSELARTMFFG
jgi:hypothetical protein